MDSVEIHDPAFAGYVLANAALEKLADGMRWLEGPVWFADHDCLLVSDLPNDRVLRWSESGGISVFRQPAGFINGQARDLQGRLLSCSHQRRCVTRTEFNGELTVLAERFEGRRLNSPNDIVVRRDGSIWFTDPPYGIQTDYEGGKQVSERPACIYRLDPHTGALTVISADIVGPNGLCFSPAQDRLYFSESGLQFAQAPQQYLGVIELDDDGAPVSAPRFLHKVAPGYADGFRCDQDGNLWTGAGDGVHCISPQGTLLGKIRVPAPVANLAFGGRHLSRLFICAGQALYAIYTNQRGARLL